LIDADNSPRRERPDDKANRSETSTTVFQSKPYSQNNASNGSTCDGEVKELANVVYVAPRHARKAKNSLQQKGWLEKRYRMIKIKHKNKHSDEGGNKNDLLEQVIAVPISAPFSEVIAAFGEIFLHHGEEELPLTTSQYASKTK
jgi:hypothetical protein